MTRHIGPYGVRVVHGYGRFAEQVVYMLVRSDDSGEMMIAYSGNRELMMGLAKRLNKRAIEVARDLAKEATQGSEPLRLYKEIARKIKEAREE